MNKKQSTFFGSAASLTAALALTIVTITLVTFVLFSCSIPTGGEGNLTLILPDGKFVTYTPGSGPGPNDPGQLSYTIHGSGPGILSKTVQGGGAISVSVVPGNWTIWVEVKYGAMLYAESAPQSVNVTAGGSNVALIELGPAWSAGNDVDFGGDPDKYAYFSADDDDTALFGYLTDLVSGGGNHVVVVEGNQHKITGGPLNLNSSSSKISLRGSGTISLDSILSMFSISTGNELIIRGPTLKGSTAGTNALIQVTGGTLTLREGTIITGQINTSLSNRGGGVVVSGGEFTMHGGTISGNRAMDGGGVYISSGIFTMNGGTISDNNVEERYDSSILAYVGGYGGGVAVLGTASRFTMNGGMIRGNTAEHDGGGVYVHVGGGGYPRIIKTGGTIGGNSASGNTRGHAVYVSAYNDPPNPITLTKYRDTTAGETVDLDSTTDDNWVVVP
ncbi:hypothetical protein AGMMS50230_16110 [Spirochaetia bacterium]|nr:hypothetical protein AGMMS50230_16110 [Spirochaetia bacterium]